MRSGEAQVLKVCDTIGALRGGKAGSPCATEPLPIGPSTPEALAKTPPDSPEGAALWADYLVGWTAWNHVRTVAALAAGVCFVVALSARL